MNDTKDSVTDALRRAFGLGQTYWQQADSEYTSQHRKADATRDKFHELCERTEDTIETLRAENEWLRKQHSELSEHISAIAADRKQLRAQLAEAQRDAERLDWLEDNWHRAPLGEWEDRYETLRAAIDAAKGEPS